VPVEVERLRQEHPQSSWADPRSATVVVVPRNRVLTAVGAGIRVQRTIGFRRRRSEQRSGIKPPS
jgi:hypothetical protein